MTEFHNKLITGDCIELLNKIKEPAFDLIFADPPFNIGFKYDKYHDVKKADQYLSWTADWMQACTNALKPTGSFYIAIGDDYAAHVKIIGEKLGLNLRNWIIWHYTFGQQTTKKFARSHTHIFYFTKDTKTFTFNDFAIRVPSDRQLIYNDKRANNLGKLPDDTWQEFPRLCGTFKERTNDHPCQMPEALLARIVSVSSNPQDLVLDPFSGSGTTALTAHKLARNYCGIDISDNYIESAKLRIKHSKNELPLKNTKIGEMAQLSGQEMYEINRLLIDMCIPTIQILGNNKLLNIFLNQFKVRMNNNIDYSIEKIAIGLEEFRGYRASDKSSKSNNSSNSTSLF